MQVPPLAQGGSHRGRSQTAPVHPAATGVGCHALTLIAAHGITHGHSATRTAPAGVTVLDVALPLGIAPLPIGALATLQDAATAIAVLATDESSSRTGRGLTSLLTKGARGRAAMGADLFHVLGVPAAVDPKDQPVFAHDVHVRLTRRVIGTRRRQADGNQETPNSHHPVSQNQSPQSRCGPRWGCQASRGPGARARQINTTPLKETRALSPIHARPLPRRTQPQVMADAHRWRREALPKDYFSIIIPLLHASRSMSEYLNFNCTAITVVLCRATLCVIQARIRKSPCAAPTAESVPCQT